ncbi:MAG: HAD-IIB family hydrolase [Agromyces sp.]
MAAVQLMAFDLDDTLAPSKSPIPGEIADLLVELLRRHEVCVISGGQFEQFKTQLVDNLHADATLLERLHLMPTCGTQYFNFDGESFAPVYAETLTEAERDAAMHSLETRAKELGLWEPETWGPILEDRGSQVTFSALGQAAPVDAKKAWDPTGEKKSRLRDAVQADLPGLEVRSGGSTSVDITRRGIDKAYGMQKLVEQTGIALEDMLFVGDRLDPDGNDYPVKALGVECVAVSGWEDTVEFLTRYLQAA